MSEPLVVHEWSASDGSTRAMSVDACDGALRVVVDGEETDLPMGVLERVMERYGKPLEHGVALDGPRVDLGDGRALVRIRHRGFYDVIARDFVVFVAPGREPIAELAASVSAALRHFVGVARREAPPGA